MARNSSHGTMICLNLYAVQDSTIMTTLTDDSRPRRNGNRQRDTFISTWHWPARSSPSMASPRPTGYRWPIGPFSASPVVHFHGLLFFTWTLYLPSRAGLPRPAACLAPVLGMIGVSLATAMTIFGFLVSVRRDAAFRRTRTNRRRHRLFDRAAQRDPLLRRGDHACDRRSAAAGDAQAADAAGRHFAAGRRRGALVSHVPRASGPPGPPPVSVTIPPAIVAYLLLVVAIVHDWRTARPSASGLRLWRPRADGGEAFEPAVSVTPPWHSFAGGILALAQ